MQACSGSLMITKLILKKKWNFWKKWRITLVWSRSRFDPWPSHFVCVFTALGYSRFLISAKSVHSVQSYGRSKFQNCQGWGREFDLCHLFQMEAGESQISLTVNITTNMHVRQTFLLTRLITKSEGWSCVNSHKRRKPYVPHVNAKITWKRKFGTFVYIHCFKQTTRKNG